MRVARDSYLLEQRASINTPDINDGTLLHCASRRGYTRVIPLLIDYGVPKHARNVRSITLSSVRQHIDRVRVAL